MNPPPPSSSIHWCPVCGFDLRDHQPAVEGECNRLRAEAGKEPVEVTGILTTADWVAGSRRPVRPRER